MDSLKAMLDYLEENQSQVDDEIKDDKKASDIWQKIEDLKNEIEDIIRKDIIKRL